MHNDLFFILTASFGAFCQEVAHWYDLRNKLESKRYDKLWRSWKYWLITLSMIMVSGLGTWILYKGRLELPDVYFIIGAGFPLIFKKLIAGIGSGQIHLGKSDSIVEDYFQMRG